MRSLKLQLGIVAALGLGACGDDGEATTFATITETDTSVDDDADDDDSDGDADADADASADGTTDSGPDDTTDGGPGDTTDSGPDDTTDSGPDDTTDSGPDDTTDGGRTTDEGGTTDGGRTTDEGGTTDGGATDEGGTTGGGTTDGGTTDTGMGGDCCTVTDNVPGCSDVALQDCVCANDPFCCDTEWDQQCVNEATADCGGCGGGMTGDCCTETPGVPGCSDAALQDCVCAFDSFCCDTQWDAQCVTEATDDCGGCGGMMSGDCCTETPGVPGCSDAALQDCVCAFDSFCCDNQWDAQCVTEATDDCGGCGAGGGDCCTETLGVPGCSDAALQDCVCAFDSFCCDTEWDNVCVGEATDDCGGCGGGGSSTCCQPQGGPGCDDAAVQDCVCAFDDFCCTNTWDGICVDEAQSDCGLVCAALPACCDPNTGMAGCGDAAVQDCVCAFDDFCCTNNWDGICVDEAQSDCGLVCP